MKIIIIAGSKFDTDHVNKIALGLEGCEIYYVSAHKHTFELLELLGKTEQEKVIYVTVAGKSNALSGVVAANTKHPVIACPPFSCLEEYSVDIHSTLRMPSQVPVLTVVDPNNCILAVKRILDLCKT